MTAARRFGNACALMASGLFACASAPALAQAMDMGAMQGGQAPADARDPDAYAIGLSRSSMHGMDMADDAPSASLLVDKLEVARHRALRLDAEAWFGTDRDKLWMKLDGERDEGRLGATRAEAAWDRVFATYWSTQVGVRHDFGPGPGRDWAAFGVQGLAPYWFEVEATAYVGSSGRTAARVEVTYELPLVPRVVMEPTLEANLYGRRDPARRIGAGLATLEAGLRLRYAVTPQLAPYLGLAWQRKLGGTAAFARADGERVRESRVVAGVRFWF